MGVEIENSIEGSLGVALPQASLLRARTIGQIVLLIAEHMGAKKAGTVGALNARVGVPELESTEELDLDALSDADIEGLLDDDPAPDASSGQDGTH